MRAILLLLFGACLITLARAQSPAVTPNPDGSVTIDAARLTSIVSLDVPWRFSPGDDPHYADLNFDDSSWALIKPGSTLLDAHVPGVPHGESWARLHFHILSPDAKLAITVEATEVTQYAVFVDGKEIATSPGFATHTPYLSRPFVIKLPLTRDSVVCIHFRSIRGPVLRFPLSRFALGQGEAIGAATDLTRFRKFEDQWLTDVLTALMYMALVPVALILFFTQLSHREYLWLALKWLCQSAAALAFWGTYSGILPGSAWLIELERFLAALTGIFFLEFLGDLGAIRYTWLSRVGEVLQLVPAVVGLFGLKTLQPTYLQTGLSIFLSQS